MYVPRPHRLPTLTALRFPAALVVLLLHLSLDGSLAGASYLQQGTVGVSFFFILSGFILTWGWRPQHPWSFYRRRLARIMPLTLLSLVLGAFLTQTFHLGNFLQQAFLLTAWQPDGLKRQAFNDVVWSLSCEVFFYLLFPLLLALLRGCSQRAWAFLTVGLLLTIPLLQGLIYGVAPPELALWLAYYFPPTRLLEFILGMATARLLMGGWRPRLHLLPVGLLALAAYGLAAFVPSWAQSVALTVAPLSLLILAGALWDLEGRRPPPSLLLTLGEVSFAVYLFHRLAIGGIVFLLLPALGLPFSWALALALLLSILLACWLLHRWVEVPLERLLGRGTLREQLTGYRLRVE